jgi:hypothetical protein
MTVREMADRVMEERNAAWGRNDPTAAIVATDRLGPEDEQAVRRVVAEAGCSEAEQDEMVRQVSARVVALVEGLADSQPAAGGD